MTERRQFCPRGHDTLLVGRDSSYRCLACKAEAMAAARARRRAEEDAARSAERRAQRQEAEQQRERDYQQAIAAGGTVAVEAKWHRLFVQTLDETESRYGLCQWPQPDLRPGGCTRRTQGVYCAAHNRQPRREAAKHPKNEPQSPDSSGSRPMSPSVRRMSQ